ncbi:MAG: hypothetical protein RIT81_30815 [Deltaproteobacteria bacterium]
MAANFNPNPTTNVTNRYQMTPPAESRASGAVPDAFGDSTVRPSSARRGDAAKRILAEMGKLGEVKEQFLHARADEIAEQNALNKRILKVKSRLSELQSAGAIKPAQWNAEIAKPLEEIGVKLSWKAENVDASGNFNFATPEANAALDSWKRDIDNALKSAEADGASRNVEINIEVSMVSAVRKNQSELADSIKQKHQSTRMA